MVKPRSDADRLIVTSWKWINIRQVHPGVEESWSSAHFLKWGSTSLHSTEHHYFRFSEYACVVALKMLTPNHTIRTCVCAHFPILAGWQLIYLRLCRQCVRISHVHVTLVLLFSQLTWYALLSTFIHKPHFRYGRDTWQIIMDRKEHTDAFSSVLDELL